MTKTRLGSIFALSLTTLIILLKYSLSIGEIIGCILIFIWICYDCWKLENYIEKLENKRI